MKSCRLYIHSLRLFSGTCAQHAQQLLDPLASLTLKYRHRRPAWQQAHLHNTRGILAPFYDARGAFIRVDILVRCVAIDHFIRKCKAFGATPLDSLLNNALCRNFESLITSFESSGYDLACPFILTTDGIW